MTTESAVRRLARRRGYYMSKSRRQLSLENEGEYMVLDVDTGIPAYGFRYDATLEDVNEWLHDDQQA